MITPSRPGVSAHACQPSVAGYGSSTADCLYCRDPLVSHDPATHLGCSGAGRRCWHRADLPPKLHRPDAPTIGLGL